MWTEHLEHALPEILDAVRLKRCNWMPAVARLIKSLRHFIDFFLDFRVGLAQSLTISAGGLVTPARPAYTFATLRQMDKKVQHTLAWG